MRKYHVLFALLILTAFQVKSQHNLTVNNGYGSGSFNTADSIYILGDPAPADSIFDGWITNGFLSDTFCIASRTIMDTADITLTQKYIYAKSWTEIHDSINGSHYYYYFPTNKANIRGLILFYHDVDGDALEWFTRTEGRLFLNYCVAKGYGVLATQSMDRVSDTTMHATPYMWSTNLTVATNPDLKNVGKIIDTLVYKGLIDYSTHLFGVGYAQGGTFLSLLATIKSYKSICLVDAPGINNTFNVSITPTYWAPSRNDVFADTSRMTKCLTNYNTLTGRGIHTEFRVQEPFPLTQNRFRKIKGVTSTKSDSIYIFMGLAGFIDAKGFVTFNPAANTTWTTLIQTGDTLLDSATVKGIIDEMFICYSEQRFSADQMYHILYFFGQSATWPVGVEQLAANGMNLTLYPNPATDLLHYQTGQTIETAKIIDLMGKEIITLNNPGGSIDISNLNPGVYIAIFETGDHQSITRKIIKQ